MTKRILIADDDSSMRLLLIRAIETLGISDILEAEDGDEALQLYEESECDLIILDRDMPGKTGLEVARAIRSNDSRVPILMVTVETHRERVLEAIHAGVSDYLVKPFDKGVLLKKLKKLSNAGDAPSSPMIYRARNVMNTGVVTVRADTTIGTALKILLEHGVSGLPVVEDRGNLVGIITEHQLVKLIYSQEINADKVCDHMTKDVLTVNEESDLSDVAHMMQQHRVRRIPVVRNDQVVGVIARRDLLRYVSENEEALNEFLSTTKMVAGE